MGRPRLCLTGWPCSSFRHSSHPGPVQETLAAQAPPLRPPSFPTPTRAPWPCRQQADLGTAPGGWCPPGEDHGCLLWLGLLSIYPHVATPQNVPL